VAFPRSERNSRIALVALLVVAGSAHFLAPKQFDDIVPRFLGNRRAWTYASGLAELTGAALLARRSTSRLGGWWAAALFVIVFPGNVYAAVKPVPPFDNPLLGYGRLPLQIPLVLWALRHARTADPQSAE
jgi:uncharacterized membrane protein